MTDDESLFDLPVEVLSCSSPGRLLKVRQSDWLPRGGRALRGGIAMAGDGAILGWVAYAERPDDLACPSWPIQALPLSLDQIFPSSVEIDIAYQGVDWRRAMGTVNARLDKECQDHKVKIPADTAEQAEKTVSSRLHGEAHREARRAFQLRQQRDNDLI